MCAAADFIISRLVPTLSNAISTRASPPIFWMDRIIPLPKALCWTMSPLWKSVGIALGFPTLPEDAPPEAANRCFPLPAMALVNPP